MESIPESRKFQRQVFRYIDEIARGLYEDDVEQMLDESYGLEFYPIETDFDPGNRYMKAGFGISGLLSSQYASSDSTFFTEREEDFREFIDELGDENGYQKKHLVQYSRLYSSIADEENIEFDHPVETLLLKSMGDARGHTLEMLQDMASTI